MKLDNYISELLYKYDCVIVPGLGGFVANYKSATLQPIQNKLLPPSKSISFNKNLTNNDGLLANFIAQKDTISFDASCAKIDGIVAKIKQELKLKKKIDFEAVGTLFLDNENRIHFEPQNLVNYLLGSYGLPVYQKQPIVRATLEEQITKQFKDRIPLAVVGGKSSAKKWLVAATIAIPLAFLAGWIPSQYDISGDLNYANLNPFNTTQKAVYSPKTPTSQFHKIAKSTVKEQIALADENTFFLTINFDENAHPFVVQLKEQPFAGVDSTYVSTNSINLNYHIIGGCFSKKNNAKRLVRKLKKDGFNASIVGKRKGLWTVSYNSFATHKEAKQALAEAKNYNTKAWILNQSF